MVAFAGCDAGRDRAGDARPRPPTTAASAAESECSPARSKPALEQHEGAIRFAGAERTYLVHVPASYSGDDRVPVVFSFHGHGSNAAAQLAYADLRPIAEREGFLVVAPNGQGSPPHFTLLGATETAADDVLFAVALLDQLGKEFCIDEDRVFATGMSNGGALSAVLACRAADRFAAAGAVAAVVYIPPCQTKATPAATPAPIVAMMGDADPVVPFAGGRVNCCGNPTIPATEVTMASFGERSGCDGFVDERIGERIRHRKWTGCDASAAVELYVIEGGGHTWPGAAIDLASRGLGATTDELDASEVLWEFFAGGR